ncbi:MAG: DUF3990 domain-containing protein [Bifidobacteriaceae bacterium]|nr:DUF3990 domain-containing protein [Bifidobacteriaceae bacterium]
MRLFHGSDLAVARPRLIDQTRGLDFGPGFYTTSNPGQAESFARSVARRSGAGLLQSASTSSTRTRRQR